MTMTSYADSRIVEWLDKNQYHPRSDKHGKRLCRYFLEDLLRESPQLLKYASNGKVVYHEDLVIGQGALRWNIDLVLGPPQQRIMSNITSGIARGEPSEIWLAVDAKSVMTEHGKARRNRQRDLNSLADIVKHYHSNSVVGGLMMVNYASHFQSPLRDNLTTHKNIDRLVAETVEMFNEIPRAELTGGNGIEAVAVIVVDHTNLPAEKTTLVTEPPAPQSGSLANYKTALRIINEALLTRFLT